jgi:hypothetical protein
MAIPEDHYAFLGLKTSAGRADIQVAYERLSKQANALANTSPRQARQIRDRLAVIKQDLLGDDERRATYDRWLSQLASQSGSDQSADVAANWEPGAGDRLGQSESVNQASNVPEYAPSSQEAGQPVAAGSRSDRTSGAHTKAPLALALLALVALLAASASAVVISRQGWPPWGHHNAASASTPTVPPTRKPTVTPIAVEEIRRALASSNQAYVKSLACACDAGLETSKTGADLRYYLAKVKSMAAEDKRSVITPIGFDVRWIAFDTPTEARAEVVKHETEVDYQYSNPTESCHGPYAIKYWLVSKAGIWKVERTQVVGTGLQCQ